MTKSTHSVDDSLLDWNVVREAYNWRTLLIGNGASLAIWQGFRYPSLFQRASSPEISHRLSRSDQTIFDTLNTTNFERVLTALWTSSVVCSALSLPSDLISERYDHIRNALVEAVQSVHVPHASVSVDTFRALQSSLLSYTTVFSTNYDLLLYWSIMHDGKAVLKDYFWSVDHPIFDVTDTTEYANSRTVLYLHGGLHLVRTPAGHTKKLVADADTLLAQFGAGMESGETPLFISEGTVEDKLAAIARSDYLSFAHGRLTRNREPLVVFGHSFSDNDRHLVDAMRNWELDIPIAISMRPVSPPAIMARKAKLHADIPNRQLLFFDASTHPLGSPEFVVSAASGATK
jgi:Domain of unknown function (DUF4917)